MGEITLTKEKATKATKKAAKSDTCKSYLEKRSKLIQKLLDLVGKARAPISSVQISSKSVYYIDLAPTGLV